MMRAAVDSIRPDRITFGTDYPFEYRDPEETREYIASIRSLGISDEDKGNILGRNVLDLFKIQG
jgi:predicted TIM-barrel fold metal-dependent hydrolase